MKKNGHVDFSDFALRCRCWLFDRLRNNRIMWEAFALYLIARYLLTSGPPESSLPLLASAYRRTSTTLLRRYLESRLAPWLESPKAAIWRCQKIGWSRYQPDLTEKILMKSIILKSPSPGGEKGVLYISFEVFWLRLLQHFDVPALLTEYFLIGASSWSPPEFMAHWALAHIGPDPVFIQVSNASDVQLHHRLRHRIIPIPLMASDWINPNVYSPKPHASREIDILMVAGWSPVKRHYLLFRALRKMRSNLRVVLIGQDMDGRGADDVFAEAKAFGVADRIEMIRDAPIRLVTEYQCNSKISLALSHHEGSCVVVAESLFADTPVAMMDHAHIGSRAYINPQTGILFRRNNFHRQLSNFIEEAPLYSPRAWAVKHINCYQSSSILNAILQNYSKENGLPWSQDIKPLCWRPDPIYANPGDAEIMAPIYEELYKRHGIPIAQAWIKPSSSPT